MYHRPGREDLERRAQKAQQQLFDPRMRSGG
jgi:hypothetical protein